MVQLTDIAFQNGDIGEAERAKKAAKNKRHRENKKRAKLAAAALKGAGTFIDLLSNLSFVDSVYSTECSTTRQTFAKR